MGLLGAALLARDGLNLRWCDTTLETYGVYEHDYADEDRTFYCDLFYCDCSVAPLLGVAPNIQGVRTAHESRHLVPRSLRKVHIWGASIYTRAGPWTKTI